MVIVEGGVVLIGFGDVGVDTPLTGLFVIL
jgi:hypothetical protein